MKDIEEAKQLFFEAIGMIETVDEEIFDVESRYLHELLKMVISSKYPKTFSVMGYLLAATNDLKLGIFELSYAESLYSIKSLYRVLLEHFLKINYIFYRFCKEKTDDVGNDYSISSSVGDVLSLAKSYNQLKAILEKKSSGIDDYKIICEFLPKYADYGEKYLKEVGREFKNFNIVKTLIDSGISDGDDNAFGLLHKILPKYAELSGFIHANLGAGQDIHQIYAGEKVCGECVYYAHSALNISVICKNMVFIALSQIDRRALDVGSEIIKIWCNFNEKFNCIENKLKI